MAYHMGDGFDVSTNTADGVGGSGGWDTGITNFSSIVANFSRFGRGNSYIVSSGFAGTGFRKSGALNETTWFAAVAHIKQSGGTNGAMYIAIMDGGSSQVTIIFDCASKSIIFKRGATTIATWSNAFVFNSFDHFQFKVIIDPTNGEVHARKNGATSDSFSATGLNTRNTANTYANGVEIGSSAIGNFQYFDDFLCWNANTSSAPYDWVGDVRAVQLMPTLDTAQKQFALTATGTSLSFGTPTNNSTRALTAGTIQTGEIISATQGGKFSSATVEFNAGFTGNAKLALYLADGNAAAFASNSKPGTLIAVSNEVNNPGTGANAFTFSSDVPVMKGWSYFFAIITDTNATAKANSATTTCYTFATSYGSGFPPSLANITSSANVTRFTVYTTLTAQNAGVVNDLTEDGATGYVSDNIVGHYDLYDLADLPYSPASIVGITLRSYVTKTDNLGKGFRIAGVSGATSFLTSEYSPLTAFSNFNIFYPTNPDTGLAWTTSAINALQIGPKVSS